MKSPVPVAEVEYFHQLAMDQFAKVGHPMNGCANIIIDTEREEARKATLVKRILKSVEQLRGECEKLALHGVTAETVIAAESRRGRLGLSPSGGSNRSPNSCNKGANTPTPGSADGRLALDGSAVALTEKWRWVAYELEVDALHYLRHGERVDVGAWDNSLVASTLRSRVHALLFELIPLERLVDGGRIRRGNDPKTEGVAEMPEDPLIKIVMGNVQDALQQLRATCRDAITIKETAVLEARLREAQPPAHFNALHQSAALSPFELFVIQYFAAEAIRLATSYGITMDGGNNSCGPNAATLARLQQREGDNRSSNEQSPKAESAINSGSSLATTVAAPTATNKSGTTIPFSPTGYLSTQSPPSAPLSPPSTMNMEPVPVAAAPSTSAPPQAKACSIM
eukprot:GILI01014472.1.p1 GENE.GILI01014472.1~~GILI01014472.1.p1  ORF type:complete len:405 (-),score=80.27 GILI01014472.1:116-1306(-)